MKQVLLFILILSFSRLSFAQENRNLTLFEAGLTANFIHTIDQEYTGGLGGGTNYEISKLHPLPGIVSGITRHIAIGNNFFFRTGGMLSYHVSNAVMNAHSHVLGYTTGESVNIKTRFRGTYLQLPVEFGFEFGEKKSLGIYCGLKGSFQLIKGSKWQYTNTTYYYDFTDDPPTLLNVSKPTAIEASLNMHATDLAIELGFMQNLAGNIYLEEQIYKGFFAMGDFLENTEGKNLKQTTVEVVLGIRLNHKEKVAQPKS